MGGANRALEKIGDAPEKEDRLYTLGLEVLPARESQNPLRQR
jgi:hypothetical protein